MRHKVYGKHLNRNKNQRTALFRALIRSLFLEESITTTEAKAKAIKGLVDRLISKARQNTNASSRILVSALPNTEVYQKLTQDIAKRYENRNSGFTNLVRIGTRVGDGAMMVRMSLVKEIKEKAKKEVDKK